MRKEADKTKLKFFLGGLAFIALAINSLFLRQEPPLPNRPQAPIFNPPPVASPPVIIERQPDAQAFRKTAEEAEAARKAAAEAEAERKAATARVAAKEEHERYLARYLNFRNSKTPGTETVGLAVISESGRFNSAVSRALADKLRGDSVEIVTSLFTPDFVSDRLFKDAFDNAYQVFKKLDLTNYIDVLVLARQKVSYGVNHALENVMSAHMDLEIGVFSAQPAGDSWTYTLTANGAGFKENSARLMAEERLIKQIAKDSKISLGR